MNRNEIKKKKLKFQKVSNKKIKIEIYKSTN